MREREIVDYRDPDYEDAMEKAQRAQCSCVSAHERDGFPRACKCKCHVDGKPVLALVKTRPRLVCVFCYNGEHRVCNGFRDNGRHCECQRCGR